MNKYKIAISLAVVMTFGPPIAAAQTKKEGMLRIACDGENAGASVSVNGVDKGSCPVDVLAEGGDIVIRAVKKAGADKERVFEQQFFLAAGTAKRLEVELGSPVANQAMQKRMEASAEAEDVRREDERRREIPDLLKRANAGDVDAMVRLAQMYEWGSAGPVDFKQAAVWFGRAAKAGNAAGMAGYSDYLFYGRGGLVEDKSAALKLEEQAVVAGDGLALKRLAYMFRYGVEERAIPKDPVAEKSFTGKSARAGNFDCMFSLARLLKDKAQADDWNQKAIAGAQAAAKDGDPAAFTTLDISYSFGAAGLPMNDDLAADFYRRSLRYKKKAAATGEVSSILRLARSYESGIDAPKDEMLAIRLARQAAATGDKNAISYLQSLLSK